MFDATIVIISFTLELSLRGVAQEVASLLIFFRWAAQKQAPGLAIGTKTGTRAGNRDKNRHPGWQSAALQLLRSGCRQWGFAPELQP